MSEHSAENDAPVTSAIRGHGYGSAHDWMHDTTEPFRGDMGSRYFCRACGTCFVHMYNYAPDIFEAMHFEGVPEDCTPRVLPPGKDRP